MNSALPARYTVTGFDDRSVMSASEGAGQWVPGLAVARSYRRSWLRPDIVAGLILATLLVPQGMAYAELAGLPAVTGLYTTVVCLIAYAIMGPSRILVLGPDSSVSPLIFAAIVPLLGAAKDPAMAIELAGMLALLVGLLEIGLGVGRLGFVADLLSKEVKVGYMNGLAVIIVVGQLPKFFGFSTDASGFVNEVKAFFSSLDKTNGATLAMGLFCLLLLLGLPRLTRKVPAVLAVIVGATVISAIFDLSGHGVKTVGALPQGLPRPQLPWTSLSHIGSLAIAAVGITLVSLTDTIATSASFAARRGDRVSADQEMVGVGCANLAAGFFQGFAVSSSASRTAVAESAGAKSQVTGLVGAGAVVLLLVFLNGLLTDLPQAALAAVIMVAAGSLVDIASLRRYWSLRRSAVILSLVSTLGVIFLGVLQGIVLAIVLSILLFFRSNWWPHGEVLERRRDGWHSGGEKGDPEPGRHSSSVVFRWEAPLFFANAGIFRRKVLALVEESGARWVVLQCEAITDIDVTAADMLASLDLDLEKIGVHMAFVELRARLHEQMGRFGLFDTLDREHFYGSVDEALADVAAHLSEGAIYGPTPTPEETPR
jgi:high affinity sulfate transporter 1